MLPIMNVDIDSILFDASLVVDVNHAGHQQGCKRDTDFLRACRRVNGSQLGTVCL
jgi:hypothetical protein